MQQVKGKQVQGLRELVTVYRECKAGEMPGMAVVFERKAAAGFGISGHWGQMSPGRRFCAMEEANPSKKSVSQETCRFMGTGKYSRPRAIGRTGRKQDSFGSHT